ncbi:hypothetical protein SARC_04555 [Sphaeroforma arctica JP610]|uniref:Uncharacterized protein n=1 Tax=Sphaeroforma arctica JP610 TaxID=667725 RepID=A0A0L0G4M9_9EUKA|nr:hypothetical protein SARC_04555 [Sphaeroforma arctica JP610]KNC83188.1 hypothetical protein SARC_04555 [Sphaeroforma arctica JP610]|eukprot:XP_014157090.1 hypothetical protein SARC_04555 [Sphaeroforma arctica JP610]
MYLHVYFALQSHLRLRPVVIGCIYDDDEGCLNAKDQKQLTCLQTYAIVPTNPQELPICVDEPIPEPSPPPPPKAQTELTPEQTNELVALVHANNYKLKMFSDEFRAKYPELRVKLVKDAIKSFAEWGRRNGEPFRRWWLTPEILEKYGLPSQEPAKPTPAATATVTATANTTANTTATTESAIAPSKAKQNATKLTKVLPKIIRQAPVKTTDRPNIADMLTTKGLPAVAVSPVSKEVADTKAQTTKAQPSISDFFRTKPTHMEAPDEEAIQPQQREPCVGSAQPTIHILVAKKKRVTPTLEQALSSRSPPTQLANMNSPQTLTSIEPQPVISCQNTANNSGNKEEIAKTIAKADIDTQTNGSSNAHLRSPKVTIRKAHSSPNK